MAFEFAPNVTFAPLPRASCDSRHNAQFLPEAGGWSAAVTRQSFREVPRPHPSPPPRLRGASPSGRAWHRYLFALDRSSSSQDHLYHALGNSCAVAAEGDFAAASEFT